MTPTDRTPPRTPGQVPYPPERPLSQDPHALDALHAQHGHADHDGSYNEDVAHEHSDINIRALMMAAAGLAAVVGVCMVAMWGLFVVFEKQAAANDPVMSPLAIPAGQLPPEPRLLTDEPLNLQMVREQETQSLQGYGWVDQGTGAARIPIDEAKKRLLEQGLPSRETPADPSMGTYTPALGESSAGRAITMKPAEAGTTPSGTVPPATAPTKPGGGGH